MLCPTPASCAPHYSRKIDFWITIQRAYQQAHFQSEQLATQYSATIQNLEDMERQRERADHPGSSSAHVLSDIRLREAHQVVHHKILRRQVVS